MDVEIYDCQEELDNVVWDKNDVDAEEGQNILRLTSTCRNVEALVSEKFGKPANLVSPLIMGGFNILYRIQVEDRPEHVIVRLPCPGLAPFPEEKTKQEAATALYVAKHTNLSVPRPLFYGAESIISPFVILPHINHCGSLSAKLNAPNEDASATHALNSEIPVTLLEGVWTQVARGLLQLSRLSFSRIGALVESEDGLSEIRGRPITHNMTDMVRLANVPPAVLPQERSTCSTTDDWYTALAEMHIAQLIFQHNDAIESEDDCRNKYVARQIFRRLAKQGHLSTFGFAEDTCSAQSSNIAPSSLLPAPPRSGPFRLWGDDFRAGNLLMDKADNIISAIDWEFTYAAPAQFILDPPWWLLLDRAESWEKGMDDWKSIYETRLITWLVAMKQAEDDMDEPQPLPFPLTTYMMESWQTGRFWLNYGARKSWAFDAMYWKHLDERFFGERESRIQKGDLWKTRVHLLTEQERDAMEPFVQIKMEECKERIIVDWNPEDARARYSALLFE